MIDFTDSPQFIPHTQKALNYTPHDVKWVPSSARLVSMGATAGAKGILEIYALSGGELKKTAEAEHKHSFKCSTFGASTLEERNLATGDWSGGLSVWDLDHLSSGPSLSLSTAHAGIINTIDGVGGLEGRGHGAPELVTGSKDGCVRVWDLRVSNPVLSLQPSPGDAKRDCWAVAFGDSHNDAERTLAAGYDNGDVKLF
ncbi:hypothetical protein VYU27_010140, partial [Nannochloropsis oceanica]